MPAWSTGNNAWPVRAAKPATLEKRNEFDFPPNHNTRQTTEGPADRLTSIGRRTPTPNADTDVSTIAMPLRTQMRDNHESIFEIENHGIEVIVGSEVLRQEGKIARM